MTAWYNENDPQKAAWLRELIARELIAPGVVDERSIVDVRCRDLTGFTQCHFFAGIGIWPYALRLAGWPDDREVWTGSCPCQPFSAAGKGAAFDDKRHLWPEFYRLIEARCPDVVFGEQVSSIDGLAWFDLVRADLDQAGYTYGVLDTCAAGIGAPHRRQRLYWVADVEHSERWPEQQEHGDAHGWNGSGRRRNVGRMADKSSNRWGKSGRNDSGDERKFAYPNGANVSLEDSLRAERRADQREPDGHRQAPGRNESADRTGERSPVNGFWRDADWVLTRPQRLGDRPGLRPVERGAQPMVDGFTESLGRVRNESITQIEEEINEWAIRYKTDAREALRNLFAELSAEAMDFGHVGGSIELYEAPLLLAALRQLSKQGWAFAESVPCEGKETQEGSMRSVRGADTATRSPRQRGLAEQRSTESTDPLHVLSSVLARFARSAWPEVYEANAHAGFPLRAGSTARVGRLRGYGDGIVAQAAAAFIGAYMDIR